MISTSYSLSSCARYFVAHSTKCGFTQRLPSRFFQNQVNAHVAEQKTIESHSIPPMNICLDKKKEDLSNFIKSSNIEKMEQLVSTAVAHNLGTDEPIEKGKLKESWDRLRELGPPKVSGLAPYSHEEPQSNFVELFRQMNRPLFRGQLVYEYGLKDYLRTPTELIWAAHKPTIPFSVNGPEQNHDNNLASKLQNDIMGKYLLNTAEEEALCAWRLALPSIDERTFIHEYGCWNGGNLLGLMYFALENGIHPGACLGTDINVSALNVADTMSKIFSLEPPQVQFHLSNALHADNINLEQYQCDKQVKIALGMLTVLNLSDSTKFFKQIRRTMTRDCSLIVSFALPKGEKYELLDFQASTSQNTITKLDMGLGTLFLAPFPQPELLPQTISMPERTYQVIGSYYSEKGFKALALQSGFKMQEMMTNDHFSENAQMVVRLKPSR